MRPPGRRPGRKWSRTLLTVPVMRHHIRNTSSRGGVTVRLAADDPQSVIIRFFDSEGLDLDENSQRKVERMYHREEFRRVLAPEIGDIDVPPPPPSQEQPPTR